MSRWIVDHQKKSGWGGRRTGAGRKRNGPRSRVAHRPRATVSWHTPVHVTMRVRKGIWSLRSRWFMRVAEKALHVAKERFGMRVTHLSIQGNHLHLVVEAASKEALSRGMQGLTVRLARGINKVLGRKGKVFEDRYHANVLRSTRAVRNVIRYVRNNRKIHLERMGVIVGDVIDSLFCAWPGHETPGHATKPLIVHPWGRLLRLACRGPSP